MDYAKFRCHDAVVGHDDEPEKWEGPLTEERYAAEIAYVAREAGILGHLDLAEPMARWEKLGSLLAEARLARGLSKREAARAAGFSEGLWRHLEDGKRMSYGVPVLPNPSDKRLANAIRAVGLDPAEMFEIVGRHYMGDAPHPAARSGLDDSGLTDEERALVQGYIDGIRARRQQRER